MADLSEQIYITEFKPLYNKKKYDKAFEVLSENEDIKKYLSPVEKRFMTMELKKKIFNGKEIFLSEVCEIAQERRN